MIDWGVLVGERVALDAMAFVYHFEARLPYYPLTKSIFQRLARGDLRAVTSSLVLTEVLVPFYREPGPGRAAELARTISDLPYLQVVDVDRRIASEAARLRARFNLRTPDAVHVATALTSGAEWFITNDHRLRCVEPEGIHIWLFDEAASVDLGKDE